MAKPSWPFVFQQQMGRNAQMAAVIYSSTQRSTRVPWFKKKRAVTLLTPPNKTSEACRERNQRFFVHGEGFFAAEKRPNYQPVWLNYHEVWRGRAASAVKAQSWACWTLCNVQWRVKKSRCTRLAAPTFCWPAPNIVFSVFDLFGALDRFLFRWPFLDLVLRAVGNLQVLLHLFKSFPQGAGLFDLQAMQLQ